MTLNFETLDIPGSEGDFMSVYAADFGSPSEEKLRILLSWAESSSPLKATHTGAPGDIAAGE
ncbi:hypothetical protein E4U02_03935 [Microbacterium paludicola]|uniref:Uncharacterized protein n=2 Tax=Microbacterium paludicola TaxID=300019 RepID=A0A4Y9FYU2_9MICO|nr:hypothetical protein E4U02_03935 [Microbacterium paludicola]